jgi:hypothetical protein
MLVSKLWPYSFQLILFDLIGKEKIFARTPEEILLILQAEVSN